MFPIKPASLIPPLVSFALALALTPLVRMLARRLGFVAKPKIDRWHKKPTAMMGGVACTPTNSIDANANSASTNAPDVGKTKILPAFCGSAARRDGVSPPISSNRTISVRRNALLRVQDSPRRVPLRN